MRAVPSPLALCFLLWWWFSGLLLSVESGGLLLITFLCFSIKTFSLRIVYAICNAVPLFLEHALRFRNGCNKNGFSFCDAIFMHSSNFLVHRIANASTLGEYFNQGSKVPERFLNLESKSLFLVNFECSCRKL